MNELITCAGGIQPYAKTKTKWTVKFLIGLSGPLQRFIDLNILHLLDI